MSGPESTTAELEYYIRVKLPPLPAWNESGDHHENVKAAICAVKPRGFEVLWAKWRTDNLKDKDGNALVPLFLANHGDALVGYAEMNKMLTQKLDRIRKAVGP